MAETISANARKRTASQVSAKRRTAIGRRHARLRKKVIGSAERPRLAVKRSSRHIVVQLIDDVAGHTLAAASSLEADVRALDGDKKARAGGHELTDLGRAREGGRHHRGGVRPWWLRLPRPHRRAGRRGPRGRAGVLMIHAKKMEGNV